MAELLVTGGAGFIGANFVRYWRSAYPDDGLTVLDALTYAGSRSSLNGIADVNFVEGDIRQIALVARLLRERGVDVIVHLAAESHVDRSIAGSDAFIETNINGTHSLLKAAQAVWLEGSGVPHRFHHVSTDEVYGSLGPHDAPFTESSPHRPNSPYAASKAASDHLVRAWHRTYGLQVTISNCSNNYGPYQYPEKLIPLSLRNCLEGRPLPLYGDGLNVRDWLHVEDHVRGLEAALKGGKPGEAYNIGGGREMTNLDLAHLLCDAVDQAFMTDGSLASRFPNAAAAKGVKSRSLIRFVTDRPGHDRRYAVDSAKASRDLGYAATIDFEDGLARTVDWYLDNSLWWQGRS